MPEFRASGDDHVLLAAEEARPGVVSRASQTRWPLGAKVAIIGLLLAGCAFGVAAVVLRGKQASRATSAAGSVKLYGMQAGTYQYQGYGGPAGTDQVLGAQQDGAYRGHGGAGWAGNGFHPQPGFDQMGHGDMYHGSRPQIYQGSYGAYHYGHYHVYQRSFFAVYFWWIVFLVILAVLGCVALYLYWKSKNP